MRFLRTGVALLMALGGALASAQLTSGGAIIAVDDGSDHACIDVSRNLVSIMLANAQLQRSQSWWDALLKSKAALGVKFDVKIQNASGAAFDFPRAKQLSVSSRRSDVGYLPMQLSVMSKYPLVDDRKVAYDNASIDLYLITIDKKSAAFDDLMTFINFSGSLPLPPNPYITGMEYFGKFAQQIVSQNLSAGPDQNPVASFSFDLAANAEQAKPGACPRGALRAGVQAVVFDYEGTPAPDMIRVSDADQYCYWYDTSKNRIMFRAQQGAACPSTRPADAQGLGNPLVAFIVSPWPSSDAPLPAAAALDGQKPSPVKFQPTAASIDGFAAIIKTHGPATAAMSGLNASTIKDLYAGLTQTKPTATPVLDHALAAATSTDLAAALALKRCAIVGIQPQDCR